MSDNLPRDFTILNRPKIREGTKALSTEDRNKLLLEKCNKVTSLMEKYSAGHRKYVLCLIRDEVKYLKYIRGNENHFIENQITRLTFEMNLIDRKAAYINDQRGFKNALEAINTNLTLIIEELNSEIQSESGD
ncbi:MAG: hypothetical protein KAS66_09000 [Candidatus Omnitrophica bacterium]|nr:hypothetical protein [Candidatus Omnitrophota bacterium]